MQETSEVHGGLFIILLRFLTADANAVERPDIFSSGMPLSPIVIGTRIHGSTGADFVAFSGAFFASDVVAWLNTVSS